MLRPERGLSASRLRLRPLVLGGTGERDDVLAL